MTKKPVKPSRSWRIRLLLACLWSGIVLVVLSFAVVGILRFLPPPSSAFMLEYGWQQYRQQGHWPKIDYRWVDAEQIAPELMLAVIASEDQRFASHHGFDFEAIQDVVRDHLDNAAEVRGASTITQQVAKNLFLSPSRNLLRKLAEAWFALVLELSWPKQRIIEVYLNIAEFGSGVYGAEAAAQHYYGLPAGRLSAAQAALLAATLPSPKRYNPATPGSHTRKRQRWILRQMRNLGGRTYLQQL